MPPPRYVGTYFQASGPSLNSAYRFKFFNPSADDPNGVAELTFSPGPTHVFINANIVALDHPEVAGTYMRRFTQPGSSNFYTVEFREKSGWDRAISNSMVAVRRWNDSLAGTERLAELVVAGDSWSQGSPHFSVTLNSIDTARHVANVTLVY